MVFHPAKVLLEGFAFYLTSSQHTVHDFVCRIVPLFINVLLEILLQNPELKSTIFKLQLSDGSFQNIVYILSRY